MSEDSFCVSVCASTNSYQENDYDTCKRWFDYSKNCASDSTCDGVNTRLPLLSTTVQWMSSKGYSPQTAAVFCQKDAPWPITASNELPVALLCQQICNECPPTTTTKPTTTTSTTTTQNTRNYCLKGVIFLFYTFLSTILYM